MCLEYLVYRPSPKKYVESERERKKEPSLVEKICQKTLSSYVTGLCDGTTQLRRRIELGGVANALVPSYSSKFSYVNPNELNARSLPEEYDTNF